MPDDDLDVCPECEQGKHGNCDGVTWSNEADGYVDCQCGKCI